MIDNMKKKVQRFVDLRPRSGSFVFCGPKNTGKRLMVDYFVEGLLRKKHHIKNVVEVDLKKDKTKIGIDQIKEALYYMKLKSQRRMFMIINNASYLSENASNALLKSLEEPFRNKIFILISDSKEDLLDTVISRSTVIKSSLLSPLVIKDEIKDTMAAVFSLGKLSKAYELFDNKEAIYKEKEKTQELISLLKSSLWKKFILIEEIEKREENVIYLIDFWIAYLAANLEAINFDDFKEFREFFNNGFDSMYIVESLKGLLKLREVLKSSNASKKLQIEAAFI